jgi:hypothetical protein
VVWANASELALHKAKSREDKVIFFVKVLSSYSVLLTLKQKLNDSLTMDGIASLSLLFLIS